MLDALAQRLTTASIATQGVNLFAGLMPDGPDLCVSLYEYAGLEPLEVMRSASATLERPRVQVMVRAARDDYAAGRVLTASVRDNLTNITDTTISGTRFLRVASISSINQIGRDEKDRVLFTLSLEAVVER